MKRFLTVILEICVITLSCSFNVALGTEFRSFLYDGRQFTTIAVPGADPITVTVTGINDRGDIVGNFVDHGSHGFLYTGGSYTQIDPGARGSLIEGINDSGQLIGYFAQPDGRLSSFLDTAGAFTIIQFPGALKTRAEGINDNGQMVGTYDDVGYGSGFIYTNGSFTSIGKPGPGYFDVADINDHGDIVGSFIDAYAAPGCIFKSGSSSFWHGFLYSGGSFTQVDYPGACGTSILGINDSGQFVGWFRYRPGRPGDHPIRAAFSIVTASSVPSTPLGKIIPTRNTLWLSESMTVARSLAGKAFRNQALWLLQLYVCSGCSLPPIVGNL